MKLGLLFVSAAVLAAVSAAPAFANVFDFSYSGPGVSASGTVTTNDTPDLQGYYTITSIDGTRNGEVMVLLPPNTYPNDGPNDNLIKTGSGFFTFNGLGFSTDQDYNVFQYDTDVYVECFGICQQNDPSEVLLDSISVTAAGVPEPASWALILAGFGGMGAAMRMVRRRGATITA